MSNDKSFFQRLKAFNEEKYEFIDMDRLVLYAVAQLEKNNIDPTYDKIVVATFKMFPKRFSLMGFQDYPDGKRIHDCLWHCTDKKKKWLYGSAKSGYHLAEKGKYVLATVERMLAGEVKITTVRAPRPQRKEYFFLKELRKTDAYKKFIQGKIEDISNIELKESLKCGINTPEEIVRENLKRYMEFAEKMEANDVKEFLHAMDKIMKKSDEHG